METSFTITAGDFSHAGQTSSEIKHILKRLNIPPKVIKRVVIALYEAEVNIAAHSYGGTITCSITSEKISIFASDTGPGIPDIELAMSEGYSTASDEVRERGFGAGMGLPNIKKNCDTLTVESSPETGTAITMSVTISGADRE
ncbi:MAG: ATP-binding protein [Spirochaetales bacterium]|jgi:serine/threonine-protein kinase RsbT|nr:ATP-binding protein [Spirochaetales bacterium]